MPRGPVVYGVKWEKTTSNGYAVQVVRDADVEDMLRAELDLTRAVYQVLAKDGDDVVELIHEFNQGEAVARAKVLVTEMEKRQPAAQPPPDPTAVKPEDYL